MTDFATIPKARRQWSIIFKFLKEKVFRLEFQSHQTIHQIGTLIKGLLGKESLSLPSYMLSQEFKNESHQNEELSQG